MPYNVKLDIFEGPLDLLLHLIKKNRVDIYDIPIAVITEQYIEHLDMMKTLNLEVAGEFILMAATLIHIKSKMLLPMPEEGAEEEEGEDPRKELIRRLLEYKRYKEAAEELNKRLILGRDVFRRGAPPSFEELEEGLEELPFSDATLFHLIEAFKEIVKRMPKPMNIDLTVDRFRIADKINHILEFLEKNKSVVFSELFPMNALKGEIVVTFLALLELAKLVMIKVNQTEDGIIRIYGASKPILGEEVSLDG